MQVVVNELVDALKGEVDDHAIVQSGYLRRKVWQMQMSVLAICDLPIEFHLITNPGHEEHWGHEGHFSLGSGS